MAPHEARLLEHASAAFAAARSEVLAAIDAQQWAEALTAARSSAHLAPRLVPPGTAALGLEWLRLAKLLAHAGQIDEAVDALEAHLEAAVQRQLMSEVPLGTFCSGGSHTSLNI